MLNITLGNKLVKGVLSRLISRSIKKKSGYKVDVSLNEIDVRELYGEDVKVKLDVELVINKKDLENIINSIHEEA